MRTTLTLDPDVAALVEHARKTKDSSLKEIVNEALRRGLTEAYDSTEPSEPFRTEPIELGGCLFPTLDDISGVLMLAEGENHR